MEPWLEYPDQTGIWRWVFQNGCNSWRCPQGPRCSLSSCSKIVSLKLSVPRLQGTTQSPGSFPCSKEKEKRGVKGHKSKSKEISYRVCPLCKSFPRSLLLHTDFMVHLYRHGQSHNLPNPYCRCKRHQENQYLNYSHRCSTLNRWPAEN